MASRVFTLPAFDKFARKSRISDDQIVEAVDRADRGLVYADLGEGVIKQAIARPNESARHGFRTIVAFKRDERAFFVFGFAKNDTESISQGALEDFRFFAAELLGASDDSIELLLARGDIRELRRNG